MNGKLCLATLAVTIAGVETAYADIFLEYGGIAEPEPAIVGGRLMTPYDVQCPAYPFGSPMVVSFAPSDVASSHETHFSPQVQHLNVGAGWATWPGAYGSSGGSVYSASGATSLVLTFPTTPTKGFYFYLEPNPFAMHSFTVTATDDSGAISSITGVASGDAGAALFTIWTGGPCITSITIDSNDGVDFAIGQFGYNPCEDIRVPEPHGPGTVCGTCCQGVPTVTGFTKPTLLSVDTEAVFASSTALVVHAFEVGAAPLPSSPGYWNAPRFEHSSWTQQNLGTIFGITADDGGNIYVTHASFYWGGNRLPLGGTTGDIYRLDGALGTPSLLEALPQASPLTGPGLGNITWSCERQCLYVTNFEDGRIYRVDPNAPAGSRIQSAWDFATDSLAVGGAPEPGDAAGLVPLGERVWAVADGGTRLFFSVWSRDNGTVGLPNTIWSVALSPAGDPIPGTKSVEIVLDQPGTPPAPVADLAFDNDCCLYAAERTMDGFSAAVAHQSALLKFCFGDEAWHPAENFVVGAGPPGSAAGGVSIDNGPDGLAWATGDALIITAGFNVYGVQGTPQTGGTTANSVLIDSNGGTSQQDKLEQGSCEVICDFDSPCLNVSNQKIFCPVDEGGGRGGVASSGCYTWTFTVTNKSPESVKYITVPLHPFPGSPITINPNVINLLLPQYGGVLLNPGGSVTVSVEICGAQPGDVFSLELSLVTPDFEVCCFDEITPPEIPQCDCGQLRNQEFGEAICEMTPGGATVVNFDFCFTLDNLSGYTKDDVIFIPADPRQAYFAKDFFFLPPLAPGASIDMCVSIQNAVPGEEFCFFVLLQHPGADCCCAFEKCIMVPECAPIPFERTSDLNHDHVIDGTDLAVLLGSWGPCAGCPADLNGDGVVDGSDLAALLGAWGPCP